MENPKCIFCNTELIIIYKDRTVCKGCPYSYHLFDGDIFWNFMVGEYEVYSSVSNNNKERSIIYRTTYGIDENEYYAADISIALFPLMTKDELKVYLAFQ